VSVRHDLFVTAIELRQLFRIGGVSTGFRPAWMMRAFGKKKWITPQKSKSPGILSRTRDLKSASTADGLTQAYDVSSWGIVGGVDTLATENLVLGAAINWSSGSNTGKAALSGSSNRVNSFGIGGYGSWSQGPLSLDGRITVGFDNYSQHRTIDMPDVTARASYSGHHYAVGFDAGYRLSVQNVTLTPTASLKWLSVDADGYTETGADALNLTVRDTSAHQFEGGLGMKLGWSIDTSLGQLQPELKMAWVHDFVTGSVAIDASMLGAAFTTMQSRPSADGLALGAGLNLLTSGDTSLRLSYDGQFRGGYTAHSGLIEFRLSY
jgi:outer membrane autotransporter protein